MNQGWEDSASCAGAIVFDRPFLAPLHTWAATKGGGCFRKFPIFVRFILQYLLDRVKGRRTVHCAQGRPRQGQAVERFRSDAKAEGEDIVIGGWEVRDRSGKEMTTKEARWFRLKLDRFSAPWAYRRGEPYRAIASLELLGSLISAKVFLEPEEDLAWASGSLSAGAVTDNQGNRFVLNRLMTTKFPLLAILCEFAVFLEQRNCLFELGWVPRDQNEEADAITNEDYGAFDMKNEVAVGLEKMGFSVLHQLLDLGEKFYDEADAEKLAAKEARASNLPGTQGGPGGKVGGWGKPKRRAGLKVTAPW